MRRPYPWVGLRREVNLCARLPHIRGLDTFTRPLRGHLGGVLASGKEKGPADMDLALARAHTHSSRHCPPARLACWGAVHAWQGIPARGRALRAICTRCRRWQNQLRTHQHTTSAHLAI